jgi:protein involved in polysaccharide export with SLBB domain
MIPRVLVAEKTVAQLRTEIVRLLPQADKLP